MRRRFCCSFLTLITLQTYLLLSVFAQTWYNHGSATYRNQTWMSTVDDGILLRQLTILGTHSSWSTGLGGDAFQTQGSPLRVQLECGIRALDVRCRHFYNYLNIHSGIMFLFADLEDVLNVVQSFLLAYPT